MAVISLDRFRERRHLEHEDEARRAFIRGDFDGARAAAERAVRYGPDCHHASILLGDVAATQGEDCDALRAYHRARRAAPEEAEPYWAISTVHALSGRWRDALKYLERAQPRLRRGDGPLYEWVAEDRAIALARLGRPKEALEVARWGLRRRPKSARLRALRLELEQASRNRLRLIPRLAEVRRIF